VYICGSYRKINAGVSLFWTTRYMFPSLKNSWCIFDRNCLHSLTSAERQSISVATRVPWSPAWGGDCRTSHWPPTVATLAGNKVQAKRPNNSADCAWVILFRLCSEDFKFTNNIFLHDRCRVAGKQCSRKRILRFFRFQKKHDFLRFFWNDV